MDEGKRSIGSKKISQQGLNELLEFSSKMDMSIVIENHGGFTSDASWLVDLIQSVRSSKTWNTSRFWDIKFLH